jgi:hypothetical protein
VKIIASSSSKRACFFQMMACCYYWFAPGQSNFGRSSCARKATTRQRT